MREKNFVYADEKLIVAVAHDLHDIRLKPEVLAAIARSLSIDGLLVAAEYFTAEAAAWTKSRPPFSVMKKIVGA